MQHNKILENNIENKPNEIAFLEGISIIIIRIYLFIITF
jgi:hypothetical protein